MMHQNLKKLKLTYLSLILLYLLKFQSINHLL